MPDAAPPDQEPPHERAPGSLFNDPETTGEPPQFVKPGQPAPPPAPAYAPAPGGQQLYAGPQQAGPQFLKPGQQLPAGGPGAAAGPGALPWGWWVGPIAVFAGFMVVIGAGIVLVAISALVGGGDVSDAGDGLTEVLTLLQQVLWIATALLIPYFVVRWLRPEHLGLVKTSLGRSVGIGVVTMIAFYALAFVYSLALGLDENSNELLNDTGFGDSVARDVVLAAVFTIGAPVSEELLFRALLFGSLAAGFSRKLPRSGPYLAALIAGVIFGLIHAGQGQDKYLPMLMALGVLLCLAYYWSGTLYVPIVLHAINNAIATGANSEPSADWIYAIIVLAPALSLLLAVGLARLVRRRFRDQPPAPPAPPNLYSPGRPAGL